VSEDDAPERSASQLTSSAPLIEDGESSADEIPYRNAPANGTTDEADDDDSGDDDDDDAPDECV
jgi:hypothetical protein